MRATLCASVMAVASPVGSLIATTTAQDKAMDAMLMEVFTESAAPSATLLSASQRLDEAADLLAKRMMGNCSVPESKSCQELQKQHGCVTAAVGAATVGQKLVTSTLLRARADAAAAETALKEAKANEQKEIDAFKKKQADIRAAAETRVSYNTSDVKSFAEFLARKDFKALAIQDPTSTTGTLAWGASWGQADQASADEAARKTCFSQEPLDDYKNKTVKFFPCIMAFPAQNMSTVKIAGKSAVDFAQSRVDRANKGLAWREKANSTFTAALAKLDKDVAKVELELKQNNCTQPTSSAHAIVANANSILKGKANETKTAKANGTKTAKVSPHKQVAEAQAKTAKAADKIVAKVAGK